MQIAIASDSYVYCILQEVPAYHHVIAWAVVAVERSFRYG